MPAKAACGCAACRRRLFHVHGADHCCRMTTAGWPAATRRTGAADAGRIPETLVSDRRALISRFRTVDLGFQGGRGRQCRHPLSGAAVAGRLLDQPLFLQLKEARPSVLEAYTDRSPHAHEGARVVAGQRLMQAVSDPFIGWTTGPAGRHFYIRQLRDMKAAVHLELLAGLFDRLCAAVRAGAGPAHMPRPHNDWQNHSLKEKRREQAQIQHAITPCVCLFFSE